MVHNILLQIATLFSVGRVKYAPGTVATLLTVPLWFILAKSGPIFYMLVVVLLVPVGIWASQVYEDAVGKHDSKEIVIDEVVGYLITMTWLPITWQSALIGFIIFRVLDILKPPPIRQLDQKVRGGIGVMADDIAAGVIGSFVMQILYTHTNWLGAQILVLTPN